MSTCSTCHGVRFVLTEVPETRTASVFASWPCDGDTATRITYATGRMVQRNVLCPECQGSGLATDPDRDPQCPDCHGTGMRNAWDSDGEYAEEPCTCAHPARRSAVERELLASS